MAKRFPLYPIIPPLCWPCRIKFVCPISHYIPMISPWNHCIHRLNYCKSIPMVVPRHIYIFKRLSLCMCVNMRDFMWSILGFLTLYPLNSINSHYTIYIYMYRIIYIYVYHCISLYIHDSPLLTTKFSAFLLPLGSGFERWTARWGWQHFQSAPAEPRHCPPGDPGNPGDPRSPGGTAIFSDRNFRYPLANCLITMENHQDPPCFMGKSTISMVIFHSYGTVYQRLFYWEDLKVNWIKSYMKQHI